MTGFVVPKCARCGHTEGIHTPGGGWLDPERGRCRSENCPCTQYRSAADWLNDARAKIDAHEQAALEQQDRLC